MSGKQGLALFDFDGTITTHDSFRDFLIFFFGKWRFMLGCLRATPWLLAYLLRLINNQTAKQQVTRIFFAGMPQKEFEAQAKKFATGILNKIVRPAAIEKIRWHRDQGHRVILVSA